MKKEIKITMSPDVIKKMLEKSFRTAGELHAELIARMIVDNLATTEMGISQLIFAYMGVEEKLPWLVGDQCLVNPDYISGYYCDKDGMIAIKHNMHKGMFIAKITDIEMTKERNIKFEFEGFEKNSKGEKKVVTVTGSAPASTIKLVLDLPSKSNSEPKRENVADIL
jgi:hypothetical protein